MLFSTGGRACWSSHGARAFAAGHLTAIGGIGDVTPSLFDRRRKEYLRIPLREQVEVLSLVGNVALEGAQATLHGRVVVGMSDGIAHGGHLLEAHVLPTLEVTVVRSPAHLHGRAMNRVQRIAVEGAAIWNTRMLGVHGRSRRTYVAASTLRGLRVIGETAASTNEDIQGRKVLAPAGKTVGMVDGLMVDDARSKVRYCRMEGAIR